MRAAQVGSGAKFNRWTVEREMPQQWHGKHRMFQCRCECGTVKTVTLHSLKGGTSKSCGCLTKETNTKHGKHKSAEYNVWTQMIYRCSPSRRPSKSWKNYGGRGITVCKEWRESFAQFLADVGPRPSMAHTLDRIDNNGNYEPGNVRWATASEQRLNQRSSFWERAFLLLAQEVGLSVDEIRAFVADGASDKELARHIARYWKPQQRLAA